MSKSDWTKVHGKACWGKIWVTLSHIGVWLSYFIIVGKVWNLKKRIWRKESACLDYGVWGRASPGSTAYMQKNQWSSTWNFLIRSSHTAFPSCGSDSRPGIPGGPGGPWNMTYHTVTSPETECQKLSPLDCCGFSSACFARLRPEPYRQQHVA